MRKIAKENGAFRIITSIREIFELVARVRQSGGNLFGGKRATEKKRKMCLQRRAFHRGR